MEFKRNQVEEAISRVSTQGTPRTELETRLKRLYETDRKLGRSPRADGVERANYAFFSAEAQGSGVEVWFSEYEAFALFTALRLLEHGLPQKTAVLILRRARPQLEPKHAEIMKWDPRTIFDKKAILQGWRPGMAHLPTTRPVFLAVGGPQKPATKRSSENEAGNSHCRKAAVIAVFAQRDGQIRNLIRAGKGRSRHEGCVDNHDAQQAWARKQLTTRGSTETKDLAKCLHINSARPIATPSWGF